VTPSLNRRRLLAGPCAAAIASPTRAGAATPEIEITPRSALQDVPLKIALRGLTPSSRIEVAAEMTARDGAGWRAHAMFQADGASNPASSYYPDHSIPYGRGSQQ